MIFLQRRRLFIWLLKAYIRKWKKTIFIFFGFGLVFFFLIYSLLSKYLPAFPFSDNREIGVLGVYDASSLPAGVLNNISFGLTTVEKDGKPKPMAVKDWRIENDGKTYIFNIKDNLRFSDGSKLTSKEINYNFENVLVERPSKNTIAFKLKENYSPFLITVSKPVLRGKFIGLGEYKVVSIEYNGEFIDSIKLQNTKNSGNKITYRFYPTEESIKIALALGEISETHDLSNLLFKNSSFSVFSNYKVKMRVNYDKLATLFYNTQDRVLSDKRLRQALSYAIPNGFLQGRRNVTPYPPNFWANRGDPLSYQQDFEHSKLLLEQSSASSSGSLKLNIKTLPKYKDSAERIKNSWEKIGVKSEIEVVSSLPSNFQVFLGEFSISKDPDQYTLWHSSQNNNITGYKNLRIDKLLEDGRQIVNFDEREKIYADFQKYLLDDSPASFLFFPYNYILTKE